MRIAYADPPYPGQAKKHYGPDAREVNHRLLVRHLQTFDGWALSTSSPALQDVLPMCPESVRVMAWVKPFAAFKKNVNPAYAWEPVIVSPARKLPSGDGISTTRDWVSANITLQRGTAGVKPIKFCYWLFTVLGAERGDQLVDLFPGSGAVTEAWETWRQQTRMVI
jgi:hypothetical protein